MSRYAKPSLSLRALRPARAGVAAAAVWVALGALGCAYSANYPEVGEHGRDPSVNNPNIAPVPEIVASALREVIRQHPVEGRFVINLPAAMEWRRANEVMAAVNAPMSVLPSPDTAGLPTYHVTKVWIRGGGEATVDILRPVVTLTGPGGTPPGPGAGLFQRCTVHLQGPWGGWRVVAFRRWPIGAETPPELYGWSAPAPAPEAAPAPAPGPPCLPPLPPPPARRAAGERPPPPPPARAPLPPG
ncbi:MAG: hypothetical protein IBJ11_11660, partial [Phycisphaerales bacterium]|nr:hypothetical protein [Phycisphaerales bacterium]